MGWTEFIAALAVFFVSHMLPVRPPKRGWLEARLGRRGFTISYSVLSLAVLAWLIIAAGRAPYVPIWAWAPWQLYVPLIAMLPACVLVTLAIGRANPFSFGGGADAAFDPVRPGLVRWMRHPLLVALALWAFAHIPPNGNLAHGILFGTFATFALAGQALVDRRRKRALGAQWGRLDAQVRQGPLLPKPHNPGMAILRIAMGLALYAGLILLHPHLFGVSPLP